MLILTNLNKMEDFARYLIPLCCGILVECVVLWLDLREFVQTILNNNILLIFLFTAELRVSVPVNNCIHTNKCATMMSEIFRIYYFQKVI